MVNLGAFAWHMPPNVMLGKRVYRIVDIAGDTRRRESCLQKAGSVKPAFMPGSCGRSAESFHMELIRREPLIQA